MAMIRRQSLTLLYAKRIKELFAGLRGRIAVISFRKEALQNVNATVDIVESRSIDEIDSGFSLRRDLYCTDRRAADADRFFTHQCSVQAFHHAVAGFVQREDDGSRIIKIADHREPE